MTDEYSTLEVNRQRGGLEAIPSEYQYYPPQAEVVRGLREEDFLHPFNHDDERKTNVYTPESAAELSAIKEEDVDLQVDAPPRKTILGLRRRIFWIFGTLGVLVVIGAIVGGVVGSKGKDDSLPYKGYQFQLHEASKISATNWTDSSDKTQKIVYLQASSREVVGLRQSPDNGTWIAQALFQTPSLAESGSLPNLPQAGSFLASAGSDYPGEYQNLVWYVDDSDTIRGLRAADSSARPDTWEVLSMGDGDEEQHYISYAGSQIAATLRHCPASEDCPGNFILAFQDGAGAVQLANEGDGWASSEVEGNTTTAKPTPLSLTDYREGVPGDITFVFQNVNDSMEALGQKNRDWFDKDIIPDIEPTSATTNRQFAWTKYGAGDLDVWLYLEDDGGVMGFYRTEAGTDGDEAAAYITFQDQDGRAEQDELAWGAITVTADGWFYGVTTDGRVLEYRSDSTGAFRFESRVW